MENVISELLGIHILPSFAQSTVADTDTHPVYLTDLWFNTKQTNNALVHCTNSTQIIFLFIVWI